LIENKHTKIRVRHSEDPKLNPNPTEPHRSMRQNTEPYLGLLKNMAKQKKPDINFTYPVP